MNRFKEFKYIIPLIAVFFTQELFMPFDPKETVNAYTIGIKLLVKLIPFIALFVALIYALKYKSVYSYTFWAYFAYFVYLVFESLYLYNNLIQFPHVFRKILDIGVMLSFFVFYTKFPNTNFSIAMNLIIVALFMKAALEPDLLNPAKFTQVSIGIQGRGRGLPSDVALMFVLPCLYFFNQYMVKSDKSSLIKFFLMAFIVVFLQHRSVWVAFVFGFILNVFLLNRQKILNLQKAIPATLVLGFLSIVTLSLVLTYSPAVGEKIGEEINNILNPQEDTNGTGGWRILQYESYWPYVSQHLFEGMRLKGFELPIQFLHPESGVPYFSDNSGHHFHSFYYDVLFYFGIIGLIIFLPIMCYPIVEVTTTNLNINHSRISFISFTFAALIYGIPYNLPFYYWAILGIALAFVELSKKEKKSLQLSKVENQLALS